MQLALGVSAGGAHATTEFALLVDHFNRRIAQWEPVVERCAPSLEMIQVDNGPAQLRLAMASRLEVVLSDDALNGLFGAACRVEEAFTRDFEAVIDRTAFGVNYGVDYGYPGFQG